MTTRPALLVCVLLSATSRLSVAAEGPWISTAENPESFPLVKAGRAAPIVLSRDDDKVVSIAAHDLALDVGRVTGQTPVVLSDTNNLAGPTVLVGTLGKNALIEDLVRAGKLVVGDLRGAWESFVIATVVNPRPGVERALVVLGSDRRGTAFGLYELSQQAGVSPWHWWADVPAARKAQLFVAGGTRRFGPPSVKYRGIFLNDEDWGLQPWAAQTFEPEAGGIGPKTYARVFELLLRLKANTLWPAMHACTRPFNARSENRLLADQYAIVMGSSHAEPMLRNNVGEWPQRAEDYNYLTNREGVRDYWEERVRENGGFENLYTLGMRGIHDSGMQGPTTDAERIRTLEQVFADQRVLLARHVRPEVAKVPQMFCAYKEVLALYRQGLTVPDDVTIVWPDDNHGYIRNYASEGERKRSGGFGVYYHLSYLGAPLSYLWLYTTPPALVWEELSKAYDHGADRIWIANVGDIKPAEIGIELFLQMAWDIRRWRRETIPQFIGSWAARQFEVDHAREASALLADYFALNYQRRPEHLQWWLPGRTPRPSPLSLDEIRDRLARCARLRARADGWMARLPAEARDAAFELVVYPVRGSTLANERYFFGELAARGAPAARGPSWAARAQVADEQLRRETRTFNEETAHGKWRGMVSLEPADTQWSSMRLAPWTLPAPEKDAARRKAHDRPGAYLAREAEHFDDGAPGGQARWEVIRGLGRTGDSVAVFPTSAPSLSLEDARRAAPRLDYRFSFRRRGRFALTAYLVPTQPLRAGSGLRFALALDDGPPQEVRLDVSDGSPAWAQGVLDATRTVSAEVEVRRPGDHTLHVFGLDPGVVLDKIVIDLGHLPETYLGPPEVRRPIDSRPAK